MMDTLKNWFRNRFAAETPASTTSPPRVTGSYRQQITKASRGNAKDTPEALDLETHLHGKIESLGPGKNVFVPTRLVREDTGTHESLKIVDESLLESGDQDGFDPYNTGRFDRSKKWDTRSRK